MSTDNSDNGSKKQEHMDYVFIGEHLQVTIKNLPALINVVGENRDIRKELSEIFALIDRADYSVSACPDAPEGASKVAVSLFAFITRGIYEFSHPNDKYRDRNRHGSQN